MAKPVQPAVGVVSKARYAEHRGCSAAYISKLIRTGRLAAPALLSDGRINVVLADQMLGSPSAEELALPPSPATPSAATARAEREAAQARLARVRADEAEGITLRRADVEMRVFDLLRRQRDELLSWPTSIAPRLVLLTSERAIADALLSDIEEKLTRFAGELEDLATHGTDAADTPAIA